MVAHRALLGVQIKVLHLKVVYKPAQYFLTSNVGGGPTNHAARLDGDSNRSRHCKWPETGDWAANKARDKKTISWSLWKQLIMVAIVIWNGRHDRWDVKPICQVSFSIHHGYNLYTILTKHAFGPALKVDLVRQSEGAPFSGSNKQKNLFF